MDSESRFETFHAAEPVSNYELNSWRRGFTPQAEIWNGRMAMFALSVLIIGLTLFRLLFVSRI